MHTAISIKKMLILLLSFGLIGCSVQVEEKAISAVSDTESSVIETEFDNAHSCVTDNTVTEKELAKFKHNIKNRISDTYKMDWNDDDLTLLFDNAADIYINYFELFYRPYFNDCGFMYDEQGILYTKSGIDYNSFVDYIKTIFTDEYSEYLMTADISPYKNINGELCYASVGRGSVNIFNEFEFRIYEQSAEKIVIIGIGYQYNSDTPDDAYTQEFYYNVVNTNNGWRFDNFELWY